LSSSSEDGFPGDLGLLVAVVGPLLQVEELPAAREQCFDRRAVKEALAFAVVAIHAVVVRLDLLMPRGAVVDVVC